MSRKKIKEPADCYYGSTADRYSKVKTQKDIQKQKLIGENVGRSAGIL